VPEVNDRSGELDEQPVFRREAPQPKDAAGHRPWPDRPDVIERVVDFLSVR
jgi:hypothetical protein